MVMVFYPSLWLEIKEYVAIIPLNSFQNMICPYHSFIHVKIHFEYIVTINHLKSVTMLITSPFVKIKLCKKIMKKSTFAITNSKRGNVYLQA